MFEIDIQNYVRRKCIDILETVLFERFVFFCIFLNAVSIAFDNPSDDGLKDDRSFIFRAQRALELFFTVSFGLEMVIKVSVRKCR